MSKVPGDSILTWRGHLIAFPTALAMAAFAYAAHGRDLGQWENDDPAVREWYRTLMQPDLPKASCCGEADAYWCDDVHVRDGRTFCRITDDRRDETRSRPHRPIGEEHEIPPWKLKFDRGNPTGHTVIFLSRRNDVLCFVQNGGI
jgi:hypothetical protein